MRSGQNGIQPIVKRGEIYWASLPAGMGSEQRGSRPVLIVQNDVGNRFSSTTIVATLTAELKRPDLPTHVTIRPEESGLDEVGMVLCEQILTLSKDRLHRLLGRVRAERMADIDRALKKSLALR